MLEVLIGSGRGAAGATGAAGEIGGTPCGVGRRPGANGGTRAGVALRGMLVGGVMRPVLPNVAADGDRSAACAPPARAGLGPTAAGRGEVVRLAASCGVAKSSVQLRAAVMGMMPPQTEHRARIPGPGTRAGSTRNTDWHSGQETFMNRRPG
jgi:hypothetical protein